MGTCPIFRNKIKYFTPPITPTAEWSTANMDSKSSDSDNFQDAHACIPQHMVAHSHTHNYGPLSLIETHSVTLTHTHEFLSSTPPSESGRVLQNRCQLFSQEQPLSSSLRSLPLTNSASTSGYATSRDDSMRHEWDDTDLQHLEAGAAQLLIQSQNSVASLEARQNSSPYRRPFTCSLMHSPSSQGVNVQVAHARTRSEDA